MHLSSRFIPTREMDVGIRKPPVLNQLLNHEMTVEDAADGNSSDNSSYSALHIPIYLSDLYFWPGGVCHAPPGLTSLLIGNCFSEGLRIGDSRGVNALRSRAGKALNFLTSRSMASYVVWGGTSGFMGLS